MPEEVKQPWLIRESNPLYAGEEAGAQQRISGGDFDHFIFAVKCNLAARIYEFSGSDYYGELFPLLARLFSAVDKQGEVGDVDEPRWATDISLMVTQILSLVEAVSTAVQMPMLVDLGRKSLLAGPSDVISGPLFFTETEAPYVSFSTFSSTSKTSLYQEYLAVEDRVISDICSGVLDVEEETGVSVVEEDLLRKMPHLVATAAEVGRELIPTERKMAQVHGFMVKNATELFYNEFHPRVSPVLNDVFSFYGSYSALMKIMVPVAWNWVVRESTVHATSEVTGIALVSELIKRMDND